MKISRLATNKRLGAGALISAALLVGQAQAQAPAETRAPAPPLESDAPIALLVDISSGQVLHARAPDRRFVPASITKVMTTYLAFELIEEGMLDPEQVMIVRPDTAREWGGRGSTMFLNAGDRVRLDDLLTGIANVSANDGSVVLAESQAGSVAAWTDAMNARAHELGMTGSYFGTPNGWPDEGRTFTTATDLVTLAEAMIGRHPGKFARYIGRPGFRYNDIEQPNRDPLLGRFYGSDGIKTGYTNEAGFGYLGTAKRGGQRLVMVIAGASRASTRARAARSYMEWGFTAFERAGLYEMGQQIGTARVQGGNVREVALKVDRAIYVNVPKGRADDLQVSITYDGPLRAPFAAGDQLATLVIDVPDMEPARIPLFAATSVEEADFFARMTNAIVGWFS